MKRSEINAVLEDAEAFFSAHKFHLPPFARWAPHEWTGSDAAKELTSRGLGWDITDFGHGDYQKTGLLMFTLRNGSVAALKQGKGMVYAEKILIVGVGQITPMHFHWMKTEDIINRGGGDLVCQVYNSTKEEQLGDTEVMVRVNGIKTPVEAGGTVRLRPGESITLPARVYHKFWGEGDRVLVGEVSTVNDDNTDNRFYEGDGRFPAIEEDEPPLRLLVCDYPQPS